MLFQLNGIQMIVEYCAKHTCAYDGIDLARVQENGNIVRCYPACWCRSIPPRSSVTHPSSKKLPTLPARSAGRQEFGERQENQKLGACVIDRGQHQHCCPNPQSVANTAASKLVRCLALLPRREMLLHGGIRQAHRARNHVLLQKNRPLVSMFLQTYLTRSQQGRMT